MRIYTTKNTATPSSPGFSEVLTFYPKVSYKFSGASFCEHTLTQSTQGSNKNCPVTLTKVSSSLLPAGIKAVIKSR